jgi:hypothetical protein
MREYVESAENRDQPIRWDYRPMDKIISLDKESAETEIRCVDKETEIAHLEK